MKPRNSVTLTTSAQGAFLLDTRNGRCFALNRVGTHIWNVLCDGGTLGGAVVDLTKRFPGVAAAVLAEDAKQFLALLVARDLVEESSADHIADAP